ncbi:unnamed protein product [Macrosiphum euphorbiae]|nr:unnamed protein product [Macrosiphum euphorbiae]
MKVKIKKYKKGNLTNKGRTDINKLKDKQICKEYVECFQNIIKSKQLDIERNLNVDKTWEHVKESINEASTKVLGKKVSKTKPWFNTICEEAVQRRKLARQELLIDTNNEVTLRRFRTRQKEASKILRCEKRKYVQNILETAELDYKTHRTRDMYKRVNDLRGGYKKKERFLIDDDGSLITTSEELAKKWASYFEKLLNCEEPNETFNFNFNQEIKESQDCEEPTLEEIKLQINMLKNNKSPERMTFNQSS